jgi:putative CocE/NonD family hydrolase
MKNLKKEFGTYSPPYPKYSGIISSSHYVPMRDGVELAMEVFLPRNLNPSEKIPALLTQTRYWREIEIRWPFSLFLRPEDLNPDFRDMKPFFTGQGYALVYLDVRGTGASYGTWPYPWPEESIEDAREIVDWIIQQPWSDGMVAGFGISYLGTTAELLPAVEHPAVKAVIPMFNHPDGYLDIAFPGGVFNKRFLRDWGRFDLSLDHNEIPCEYGLRGRLIVKGVKPVDGSGGREKLKEAVRQHRSNGSVYALAQLVSCRDERREGIDIVVDDITVHKYADRINSAGVPVFGFGSWMDAGTADAVLRRFMSSDFAVRGAIGAWEHGGRFHASPYEPPGKKSIPPPEGQWAEMLRFFDCYLKHPDPEIADQKVLFYYTMGEEKWKRTAIWPPEGVSETRWYLRSGGSLSIEKPVQNEGFDDYKVDFEATTGLHNRWWEMSSIYNTTVTYPDRVKTGGRLLSYCSPPLERDIEITGYPVVMLHVSCTEPDGVIIVYLEDMDEKGRVIYLTEGLLRAVHRKISREIPPYSLLVPYHSYKKSDQAPLIPGEKTEFHFGLLPTSVLIRKGHRIRVSIAGHDKDTFARIPEKGNPVWRVERNSQFSSYIDLPIIPR